MTRKTPTSSITLEESIADFLLRRLREVGLAHVFGVAGDFNLELLEQMESADGPKWVGCCNELNAAYAADGYARTHGLSALITTYGVGELSALCGIAGAFAEHLPIIAITGAPPISEITRGGLVNHTAGDGNFQNMMECGRQFSVAQARISPLYAFILDVPNLGTKLELRLNPEQARKHFHFDPIAIAVLTRQILNSGSLILMKRNCLTRRSLSPYKRG